MASLFKRDTSNYWYASWRSGDRRHLVSTKVPIKGAIINGIKETPTHARTRAQIIADGYEAADKEGIHSAESKQPWRIISIISLPVSPTVPVVHLLQDLTAVPLPVLPGVNAVAQK